MSSETVELAVGRFCNCWTNWNRGMPQSSKATISPSKMVERTFALFTASRTLGDVGSSGKWLRDQSRASPGIEYCYGPIAVQLGLENPIWMFKWMCNHRGPRRQMNSGKDAFTSKTLHHCAELQVFRLQASEDRQPCIYIAFGSGSAIYLIEPLGYTKSAVNHCSLATKPWLPSCNRHWKTMVTEL